MIVYKEEQVTVQKPVEVVCDKCGSLIEFDPVEIRHEFGYGSEKDGDYIEADLCEGCFMDILRRERIKYREFKNALGGK